MDSKIQIFDLFKHGVLPTLFPPFTCLQYKPNKNEKLKTSQYHDKNYSDSKTAVYIFSLLFHIYCQTAIFCYLVSHRKKYPHGNNINMTSLNQNFLLENLTQLVISIL